MSLSRLSLKQPVSTAIIHIRLSSDRGSVHDEWVNPKMPTWVKELYQDPKQIEKAKELSQDKDWTKKALWRRLPWNRDFESFIPETVDDIHSLDNPSLWQKIYARFKGIPLKGEPHLPKSLFDDIGKPFIPPNDFTPMPKDYKEFPERDLVNFPNPDGAFPYFAPKNRLLMFPDSWFQPFLNVTGVSGPYLLLIGFTAFCFSKEIAVINEDFTKMLGWTLIYIVAHHGFANKLGQLKYAKYKSLFDYLYGIKEGELKDAKQFRTEATLITDSMKAVKENFPTILRENLALQLEAVYRANISAAYNELKKRLDYLSEVEDTKERFERDMIIRSISEGVRKQIMANENKIRDRYLEDCIAQLKALPAV